MKKGAYDFIVKPFDVNELVQVINNAIEKKQLLRENLYLKDSLDESHQYQQLVGRSAPMVKIQQAIETIAQTKSTVLITGESGTGKELVARAIHAVSGRANLPYVVVNCAAIPENLLESTLFGHEAGAFTGAESRKLGKFEIAHTGTIFLDEIGCMSYAMQSKLLRVLQESTIERVGGNNPIQIDVRVVAATNSDLKEQVQNGKFRDDLYFRLNVIPIHVPPLRHRKDDLPVLVQHFIKRFNRELNKNVKGFDKEALQKMLRYDWPGNVRELQNLVERAVVLGGNGIIGVDDICLPENTEEENLSNFNLARISFERELIEKTLEKTGRNQSQAAKILGMHRTTLISKIKSLGLRP
jgi:DNA-binding NtrC family response regulator